ncbi:MAG: SDR family NAD(P)-dependent oxidoreductase [Myxococcales bacterium]|nr:SDR family NAD(P)-dependent oxidoreductase [Myxococcales bacterium]MCB9734159.1 SDR family NAD(P)-dependent oxidoreductase [Deltaproteobacteria bacterium]
MSLKDQHVVVTGGTGALGRAVVADLVEAGAHCHVPCVSAEELTHFDLRDHARVSCELGVDLTDEGSVTAYFGALPPLWGSVHIVGGFAMAPLADTDVAAFRRMFELNAVTCFLCCREAVSNIRRGGAGSGGRIVNVAARPGLFPTAGMVAYATSKAAVVALTHHLAEELKDERILVNAVAPSIMDTRANRAAMPDAPHDRWPKVEEVARAVRWLVSPANVLTTGLVMPVFGQS